MIKLELSPQQVQALYGFLGRVQLQGSEAPAYMEILNLINKQFQEQQTNQKEADN